MNIKRCGISCTPMFMDCFTQLKKTHKKETSIISAPPSLLIAQILEASLFLPHIPSVSLGHLDHILPDGCWEDVSTLCKASLSPSLIYLKAWASPHRPHLHTICLFLYWSNLTSSPQVFFYSSTLEKNLTPPLSCFYPHFSPLTFMFLSFRSLIYVFLIFNVQC